MGYVPPSEATPRVKAAAMKAVELDPTLGARSLRVGHGCLERMGLGDE